MKEEELSRPEAAFCSVGQTHLDLDLVQTLRLRLSADRFSLDSCLVNGDVKLK